MYRTIIVLFTVLLLVFPTYGQTVTPRERLEQVEKMHHEAMTHFQSIQNLSGEAYTNGYHKYIDIMNTTVALALKFVDTVDFTSLGKDDLLALLKIAETAQNELKQASILAFFSKSIPK